MQPTSKQPFLHPLLTGINRMIPFVVVGALFAAFSSQLSPISRWYPLLEALGPQGGLALMLPVLAGFIAHALAGWEGLLPGMIGGLLAARGGSGMLGAIAAGYLAGYTALWLTRAIRLPAILQDLKAIVLLPALSTMTIGLLTLYGVNPPVSAAMALLQGWLSGLQGEAGIVFGLILGAMAAFDMGGPVNKVASLFALDLLATGNAGPLGAVVAGVMVAPMGMYLAMRLSPRRYSREELALGKTAVILGLFNIAEPTIPIAALDPRRVLPAITLGGAVAGGFAFVAGVGVRLPVGGFVTVLVPGMVTGAGSYLLAIGAGALVTALLVNALKPVKA